MIRTTVNRGAIGTIAGLVMVAGLSAPALAKTPVPLADSGGIVGWGDATYNTAFTVPTELQDAAFSAVSAQSAFSLALTTAGKVKVFGESLVPGTNIQSVPADLANKTVTAISTSANNAAAVTSDGNLYVWGKDDEATTGPWDVPAGLTGVKDITLATSFAAAVKTDGTVVAWGNPADDRTVVSGLANVQSIALTNSAGFALKTDGTVSAWGQDTQGQKTLPAELTTPGNVKDVSARNFGGLALLADGTLASWGQNTVSPATNAVPTSVAGKQIVAIATSTTANAVIDTDGALYTWGQVAPTNIATPPAGLSGSQVKQLTMGSNNYALAITTAVKKATPATISGTPKDGQTLTATPATFSGAPDTVTGQWLAGGVDIPGATGTTLTLTAAQLGKTITYASTATKGASAPLISTSTPTAAVSANVIASKTVVSAPSKAYGTAGTATVTVSNTGGRPVTGTITLTGAGAAQTKALVSGKATFALAKNLAPKAYTLSAKYNGSAQLTASTGAVKYTVAKGKVKAPTFKASKAPTSKKAGKGSVTVTAPSGLAKATGKVTITLKGKSSKKIKATLSGGKKTFTLPKLKKGTYKVTVAYAGDKNYGSAKSKTYTLKIKK